LPQNYSKKAFWDARLIEMKLDKRFPKKQTVLAEPPRPAFSGGPARARTKSIQSLSDSDIPSPSPSEWPLWGRGGGTEIFMSGAFTHTPMRLPSLWYTARWTQRWSLPVHLLLIFGPGPDPWKCSCELYRTSLMQAADTTHRRLPIMLICYSWSTWPHISQPVFNSGTMSNRDCVWTDARIRVAWVFLILTVIHWRLRDIGLKSAGRWTL